MKLWLAGGTVRDHLLGLRVKKDLDFAVEGAESFDHMEAVLMTEYGLKVWQRRPEFVTLRGKATFGRDRFAGLVPAGRHDVDFTMCRAESMYSDGRHPDTVTPASLTVDLARRDFTVNAVAVSERGEWFDPWNGRADAENRVLRCVGDPWARFEEDPLRMLRALRFTVCKQLLPDVMLGRALNDEALCNKLRTLPVERVRDEMHKAFHHDWLATAHACSCEFATLAHFVQVLFPELWLRATTEDK